MRDTRLLFIYLFALLLASSSFAQTPLTKEEKKKAIDHYSDSQKELLKIVKGLSDEQMKYKSSEDSWSIAECLEHIVATESGLFMALDMSLQAEPNPDGRSEVKLSDEEVLGIIGSRENKVKTRPELEPTNRFGSPEGTVDEFKKLRKTKIDFIKTTDQDLRNRYFDFPFGKVDTYQLVLFISGHTVRHIDQIKEILADDSFPNT
ncbi:MAG: DinB family protein [bacterium]|nr:DinB family protein [bacterium]